MHIQSSYESFVCSKIFKVIIITAKRDTAFRNDVGFANIILIINNYQYHAVRCKHTLKNRNYKLNGTHEKLRR